MSDSNKPVVRVGIKAGKEIRFVLSGSFRNEMQEILPSGEMVAQYRNGKIALFYEDREQGVFDKQWLLSPAEPEHSRFTLKNVTIGIGFHWEQHEEQVFKGKLLLLATESGISAINILPVEDYLISVISSEMKATSSFEMLKAHAVISRSWLLAQIDKGRTIKQQSYQTSFLTYTEWIKWYDREDHTDFDVCADDHCQRYQGITKASASLAEQAVLSTSGQILMYDNRICDTRFSKCCGGVTERFENVWEPVQHPYLQAIKDGAESEGFLADLSEEHQARLWITTTPDNFCNTTDKNILSQVLNDYDQHTNDFYRWKVVYTAAEVSALIKNKLGLDFGIVQDIIPLQRGASGRIIKLKIVGTVKTLIIGKELEIRKALSATHLYSSAFIVDKSGSVENPVFTLYGAGWGHGVGLCQIGAAVMGAKGYTYKEILTHYFRGADIIEHYGKMDAYV
jgi:stage II sporulation protein D